MIFHSRQLAESRKAHERKGRFGDTVLYPLAKLLGPFLFSIIYATILASLPLLEFKDRANYIVYAESSGVIFALRGAQGLFPALANEPLWLLINVGLAQLLESDQILRLLIFLPAFSISFILLRRNWTNAIWIIMFLLVPQVIKNHIIHLRQGVAIAIFLIGYYTRPNWLRFLLMGAAGFIHASFLIVAAIGGLVWVARTTRFSPTLRIILFSACFLALAIVLDSVAVALGARQGLQYADEQIDVSGLGFVFWLSIFLLALTGGSRFLRENMFPVSMLLFYLAAYFFVPVSARVFESVMLISFVSLLSIEGWRKSVFLLALFFYSSISYFLRLDQPWLGWGLI